MITPKRNGGLGTSGMLNFCELCKFWLSRQNQAKYSTETWMFWLILKHKLMFLQWILGHLIVLYKLPLSKLEFKTMIFTHFLHFFHTIYHSVHCTSTTNERRSNRKNFDYFTNFSYIYIQLSALSDKSYEKSAKKVQKSWF